jgi:DNA-binding NarL/FixJ family response regulator
MAIRLLVVDDHVIIRDGIRYLCSQQDDWEMVGEAGDGQQALALYDELLPDVVVMDVAMPILNGLQTTIELRKRHPEARVVVLSMHADPHYIGLLREAGARGYVLKETVAEELVAAVHKVMAGETTFPAAPLTAST